MANIHKGNYYVAECEHILSDSTYDLHLTKLTRDGINRTTTTKGKKKKIDLASMIPNNPNIPSKTPTIILNTTKGPEASNLNNIKKIYSKPPGSS